MFLLRRARHARFAWIALLRFLLLPAGIGTATAAAFLSQQRHPPSNAGHSLAASVNEDNTNPFAFLVRTLGRRDQERGPRGDDSDARDAAKRALVDLCTGGETKDKRTRVEGAVEILVPYSPVKNTASSPLLQKTWKL